MYKVPNYPLDKIFLGIYQEKHTIAYLNESEQYINLLSQLSCNPIKFNEKFKPDMQFDEALENNELDILLIDHNGMKRQQLSQLEIENLYKILERKLSLSGLVLHKNNQISMYLTDLVASLLGLNTNDSNIVTSAKKLNLFKKNLYEFIKASLLAETKVLLVHDETGCDYRISRSLIKSKIKRTKEMQERKFVLTATYDGKINLNGREIDKNYQYQKKLELK